MKKYPYQIQITMEAEEMFKLKNSDCFQLRITTPSETTAISMWCDLRTFNSKYNDDF